jgi:hypothetical protein
MTPETQHLLRTAVPEEMLEAGVRILAVCVFGAVNDGSMKSEGSDGGSSQRRNISSHRSSRWRVVM